ncbi:M61 family metallopeptidase [Fulvivirga sp. M361]|uniref:M61 family metallopeptidase n=1 Tax=Fulvivirga sp. M361 TaxID=2594266 RepID=UPI0011799D51|nr:M61 family metallopeptidase [Fulvivirga sp. M361]TRX62525.1 M61 family metallopeptidase [Fulvivirga sp. M361]
MDYSISYTNPLSHFLEIKLVIRKITRPFIDVRLPTWRPGRYEAANYAKNIQQITAHCGDEAIAIHKIAPAHWRILCGQMNEVSIRYLYYADQMDAGASVLSTELVYINFVNCMLYVEDRMDEPCRVKLDIPTSYDIACGLPFSDHYLFAPNYYTLADSPLMACNKLEKYEYTIGKISFYLWLNGKHTLDIEGVLADFKRFSQAQIDMVGEFPEKDYHFLFHLLPYKFYHGVEHGNSTVITIGPGKELNKAELYNEFIGVSSHELFHAWNIIKIRPKEMMPYDFSRPPVFPTGFVAEGFTTYYGDLFLKKSGVFSWKQYKHELEKLFTRHFLNFGRLNNSVIDSSLDLWIDGYQPGAPHKKSSIYVEGAVMALLFDLHARYSSGNKHSLDDVIKLLWERFGKTGKGYTIDDIEKVCSEVSPASTKLLFNNYIKGITDTQLLLEELLAEFGIALSFKDREKPFESMLGVKLTEVADGHKVVLMEPGAPGEQHFSYNDIIIRADDYPIKEWLEGSSHKETVRIELKRKTVHYSLTVPLNETWSYLKLPVVNKIEAPSPEQEKAQKLWMGE